jgi:predicted transcriptional regulator
MKAKFLLSLVVAAIFSSCSGPSPGAEIIPSEAETVMSFNLKSLYEKAKLDELGDNNMLSVFEEEVKNESQEFYDFYQRVKEDPLSTGIDLREDIYLFQIPGERKSFAMSLSVYDREDFENTLNTFKTFIRKMEGKKVLENVKEGKKDGYSYWSYDETHLAYNDDAAIIMVKPKTDGQKSKENAKDNGIDKLMTSEPEDNLVSQEPFEEFVNEASDVNFYVSSNLLKDYMNMASQLTDDPSIDQTLKSNRDMWENNSMSAHMTFKEDEVDVSCNLKYNEKLQNYLDDFTLSTGEVDKEMISYFDAENIMVASISVNMKEYYGYLKESGQLETLKGLMGGFNEEFDIDRFMKGLNGNMILALKSIEEKEVQKKYSWNDKTYTTTKTMPKGGLVIGLNDKAYFESLFNKYLPDSTEIKNGLRIVEENDQQFFISLKENSLMISTVEDQALKHKNGEAYENSLLDSRMADRLADYPVYCSLKLSSSDLHLNPKTFVGQRTKSRMKIWDAMVERLEYRQKDINNFSLTMYMNDGGENSLHRLVKFGNEAYKSAM